MMNNGCLGVDYRPVTLKDGRIVCTECDDYLKEAGDILSRVN